MVVTAERIVADVRTLLGENRRCDDLLAASDIATLTLNGRIRAAIAPAARELTLAAPAEALDEPLRFADDETPFEWAGGHGVIPLPDDFLRLASFRLGGWSRGVGPLLDPSDQLVAIALATHVAGLIFDSGNPAAWLCRRNGRLCLEFCGGGGDGDAEIDEAFYWPSPALDRDGGIAIAPRLYDDLIAAIAGQIARQP